MNPSALARVRTVLLDLVTQGVLPGAVALVQHRGRTVLHEAVGLQRPANPAQPGLAVPAMAPDTVFRIYSMTKPIASLVALMLMEEGRLLLAHPVSRYLPAFKGQQVYDAATGTLAPAARSHRARPAATRQA
jgi:CubicO group peptidase (beta-lactamase class C family)